MSFQFTCPNCQKPFEYDDSMDGKSVLCPGCGKIRKVVRPPKSVQLDTAQRKTQDTSKEGASSNSAKSSEDMGGCLAALTAIAAGLAWLIASPFGHPKLAFWLCSPIMLLVAFLTFADEKIPKFIDVGILAAILYWGWKVYH